MGRKHWLGITERRHIHFKRFKIFFSFFPYILTFKRKRTKGYLYRSRLIREYLSSNKVAKLQLGAAENAIDGWLNTSLKPRSPKIVFLDVTEPFPFDQGVFDYILAEHLIEHLAYNDAKFMFTECFRVLKPGGRIRLSTPDLAMLAGLISREDKTGERYVKWIALKFPGDVPVNSATVVVNNLFYNWGHRFLYDFQTLRASLEEVGFTDVTTCGFGLSEDTTLNGVKMHRGNNDLDEEMCSFEALVVEAVRPVM